MTAHSKIADSRPAFIVYDIERSFDERVCRTEQDVRDFINGADLSHQPFIVVEFDAAEGRCRDVTDLFVVEEVEADDAYGIPSPGSLLRQYYARVL